MLNELLEDDGRRAPIDAFESKKATIEPGRKQMPQVSVHAFEPGTGRQERQEIRSHRYNALSPARRAVGASEELLAWRFDDVEQPCDRGGIRLARIVFERSLDRVAIPPERWIEQAVEELLLLRRFEPLVARDELPRERRL
jgi:hypothetical protein